MRWGHVAHLLTTDTGAGGNDSFPAEGSTLEAAEWSETRVSQQDAFY